MKTTERKRIVRLLRRHSLRHHPQEFIWNALPYRHSKHEIDVSDVVQNAMANAVMSLPAPTIRPPNYIEVIHRLITERIGFAKCWVKVGNDNYFKGKHTSTGDGVLDRSGLRADAMCVLDKVSISMGGIDPSAGGYSWRRIVNCINLCFLEPSRYMPSKLSL